ncbi:hypothetical protein LRS06_24225 [Hymenobacter sp. J193]|uniref:hypothetical protein n=1 Tax=Hymenobacter sp. J193 TaxID=2898429 RepID=UPI00215144C6|nr:hypothetical protein [Hymenobacter sp. J193]MCR5890837.1 hypothetical protein [Hymenobacter sp. J193]
MSDYEDGYEVGRNAPNIRQSYQNGKAIGNGLAVVLGLGFRLVVETLVLAPFLVLGLVLTTNLDFSRAGFRVCPAAEHRGAGLRLLRAALFT